LTPSCAAIPEPTSGEHFEYEIGCAGAKDLLSVRKHERPTALFAFNDAMAIGALRYALERGLRVPDDLSIVGVDNIPLSSFVSSSLTTVGQPMTELGRTAAQLLLDRIEGVHEEIVQKRLLPSLIIRESTGAVDTT
jgi:LacI family transcriptional regulator